MDKISKKKNSKKKPIGKIGKYLKDHIGIFGGVFAFPLIFIIVYYGIFTLNINSYRIISTFCSIIIGFGINAFIIILKLNVNSIFYSKKEIKFTLNEKYAKLEKNKRDSMKKDTDWIKKLDKYDKKIKNDKKNMLEKIKIIIFIAFGIVLISIFAVSSSIFIPILFEIIFIYAICIIGCWVILFFKKFPKFYSMLEDYKYLLEEAKLENS